MQNANIDAATVNSNIAVAGITASGKIKANDNYS